MVNLFNKSFDSYVCEGDTITARIDGFDVTARIERDEDYHIDDDDCHNPDQKVTGCDDEQFALLLKARQAWFNDEWFYCGVTLSVSKKGVTLVKYAASLWGIEANYPKECCKEGSDPNDYLTEVANELLDEAVKEGKAILAELCHSAETDF